MDEQFHVSFDVPGWECSPESALKHGFSAQGNAYHFSCFCIYKRVLWWDNFLEEPVNILNFCFVFPGLDISLLYILDVSHPVWSEVLLMNSPL